MKTQIDRLYYISKKKERRIIGLMSGTSLDGLDIAICNFIGSGSNTNVRLEYFKTIPYTYVLTTGIQKVFAKGKIDFQHLCQLNKVLGDWYAQKILELLQELNLETGDIDLIASHGQTVIHVPNSTSFFDGHSTLQIGDGDQIAAKTGIITLSDFRQKHIASGGEGAPLAIYADSILFRSEKSNRILLNLGGIANFTFLPKSSILSVPFTTDTGPANTLIDQYCKKYFHINYDNQGQIAKSGKIIPLLLESLKKHPFFHVESPKSTGQESFNLEWVENEILNLFLGDEPHENIVATISQLTIDSVFKEVKPYVLVENLEVYVSGGGFHNMFMMEGLKSVLPNISVKPLSFFGIPPDAKEAVMFALFANETMDSPDVKRKGFLGKKFPMISLGKISLPL
ncbi:MAG: anhydro-N-acetylmuramic acid kinase [Saprospiraceae bacterium]